MKSPRTITSFTFRDPFLALKKLAWNLAKNECFIVTFIADIKVSLHSSQVDVTVNREASFTVYHCQKWNWKSESKSLSSSSRNLRIAFTHGQLVQWCIKHSRFDGSHTTLLIRSLYVTSQFRASIKQIVF